MSTQPEDVPNDHGRSPWARRLSLLAWLFAAAAALLAANTVDQSFREPFGVRRVVRSPTNFPNLPNLPNGPGSFPVPAPGAIRPSVVKSEQAPLGDKLKFLGFGLASSSVVPLYLALAGPLALAARVARKRQRDQDPDPTQLRIIGLLAVVVAVAVVVGAVLEFSTAGVEHGNLNVTFASLRALALAAVPIACLRWAIEDTGGAVA